MKKLIKTLALLLAMVFAFAPAIHAANFIYTYQEGNTTVRITHDGLSEEKLLQLAQCLVAEESNSDMQAYGLMCTLFGHKLATTHTEVVTHMVYDIYPHCKSEYYSVTICERNNCNYSEIELLSTDRIGCCVP